MMNSKDSFDEMAHSMVIVAVIVAVAAIAITSIIVSAFAPKTEPMLHLKIETKPQ
jgi:hypothetical protein